MSNQPTAYYHPSGIPTEANVSLIDGEGIKLADAASYLQMLNLDFNEPQGTPGTTGIGSVSKLEYDMPAIGGGNLQFCDWRQQTANGYTYGGRFRTQQLPGRFGIEPETHTYQYSINEKGRGAVTEITSISSNPGRVPIEASVIRFLEMKQPERSAASAIDPFVAATQFSAIPITFTPPQDCYTWVMNDALDNVPIRQMEAGSRKGKRWWDDAGHEGGSSQLDRSQDARWNFYREHLPDGQLLTHFTGCGRDFVVPFAAAGDRSVYNTTGFVDISYGQSDLSILK